MRASGLFLHYGTGRSRFEGEKVHGPQVRLELASAHRLRRRALHSSAPAASVLREVTHSSELGFFTGAATQPSSAPVPGEQLDNAYSVARPRSARSGPLT